MKTLVQKFLPPTVVFAAAMYLGWPAGPSIDTLQQTVDANANATSGQSALEIVGCCEQVVCQPFEPWTSSNADPFANAWMTWESSIDTESVEAASIVASTPDSAPSAEAAATIAMEDQASKVTSIEETSENGAAQDVPVEQGIIPDEESTLVSKLTLAGVAQMGGQRWAVINGRTRMTGDDFHIGGERLLVHAIASDHIVLRSAAQEIVLRKPKRD